MELFEAIHTRRTIRKYTGAPVPREDLIKIIDAGRMAPTGNNRQPWDFIVITNKETIQELKAASTWVEQAGAVIAVVLDTTTRWWLEDGVGAIENMLLAATALGYGACWLEAYTIPLEERFKKLLGIPRRLRLLTLIPIGVAAETPSPAKKSVEEVIHWEKY